jgi:hypothetical protein
LPESDSTDFFRIIKPLNLPFYETKESRKFLGPSSKDIAEESVVDVYAVPIGNRD